MKKFLSHFLCTLLLVIIIVIVVIFNFNKPRVMILHSYNTDYSWTNDVNVGLKRVMDKWTNYSVIWHYMDTKNHTDQEWLQRAGIIARQTIDQWQPHVLIAIDNAAQDVVAQYYVDKPGINIIFAGINGPIELYRYHTAKNVTGILEQRSLDGLRDTVEVLENSKIKGSQQQEANTGISSLPWLSTSTAVSEAKQQIKEVNSETANSSQPATTVVANENVQNVEVNRVNSETASLLSVSVTVGDSLSKIFKKHNLSKDDLHQLLKLGEFSEKLSNIRVSQKLEIKHDDQRKIEELWLELNSKEKLHFYRTKTGFMGEMIYQTQTVVDNPPKVQKPEENKPQISQKQEVKKSRLFYIMDSSSSVLADKDYIDLFDWSPLEYVGSFVARDWPAWQQKILEVGEHQKADYIIVTNYRKLPRTGKENSDLVPASEVMTWTEAHSAVPVIGLQVFNVEDGGMLAIGVSPYEQGEVVAKMAQEIIEGKRLASTIPIVPNRHFIIALRKSTLVKRNLKLPAIYESFSRATNTYYE